MTPEQKKVINRCAKMLKTAFQDLTGYVRFDMCSQTEEVKPSLHYGNLKVEE